MGGWNEQVLLGLAPGDWQPLSARARPVEAMSLRLRAGLLGAVALLHLLAFFVLLPLLDRWQRPLPDEEAVLVDFIEAPPPSMQAQPNETIVIRRPEPAAEAEPAPPPARVPRARPTATVDAPLQVVDAPARPKPKLELYNPDGSLRVPADMLDKLDEKFGDKRAFSYQIPHYEDAKKYFERNPALVYEKTRFDEYWTPDSDALTQLLQKAVEKTTKQIKVKVPGTDGSYMVCTISVLALGGGCGVLTNGADWNGPQDDPDTLNPEEDRQCQAWWNKIVQATTQDAWHATKELYEANCRKPLARTPSG